MKQNLVFAFVYNGLGIPVAAGAVALSSLSVVATSNRLRRFVPKRPPHAVRMPVTDPVEDAGRDKESDDKGMDTKSATVKDPGCGMGIDPANAAKTIERDGEKFFFCSEGCAAAFEAAHDPHAGHSH